MFHHGQMPRFMLSKQHYIYFLFFIFSFNFSTESFSNLQNRLSVFPLSSLFNALFPLLFCRRARESFSIFLGNDFFAFVVLSSIIVLTALFRSNPQYKPRNLPPSFYPVEYKQWPKYPLLVRSFGAISLLPIHTTPSFL